MADQPPPVIIPNTVNPPKAPAAGGAKPKLIFKPVVPIRKREPAPSVVPPPPGGPSFRGSDRGRGGRGSGSGERGGRGRGRGRGGSAGGAAREVDPNAGMTASGVFSMGPSQNAGRSRASAIRTGPSQFDAPSSTLAPSYKLPEDRKPRRSAGSDEEYSDQEAGVEIVDMADLESLDVMAPTALRRERDVKPAPAALAKGKVAAAGGDKGKGKALARVKAEPDNDDTPSSLSSKAPSMSTSLAGTSDDDMADGGEDPTEAAVHAAQALDLDEEDEPEDVADVRGDFTGWEGEPVPDNQFYFFQFPKPFPKFLPTPAPAASGDGAMDVDPPSAGAAAAAAGGKKGVSFAPDVVKTEAGVPAAVGGAAGGKKVEGVRRPEGQIGELVTTKKGRVKMRLGNGILYDVNPGSDLEFLQHVVHLDSSTKRATPIAEAKRRFVVTPDMDRLLALLAAEPTAAEKEARERAVKDEGKAVKGEDGLQAMQLSDDDD